MRTAHRPPNKLPSPTEETDIAPGQVQTVLSAPARGLLPTAAPIVRTPLSILYGHRNSIFLFHNLFTA